MTDDLRKRYAEALRNRLNADTAFAAPKGATSSLTPTAWDLADAVLAIRDAEIERLRGDLDAALARSDHAKPIPGISGWSELRQRYGDLSIDDLLHALTRSEDECAALRTQLTAAKMALKGAEKEAEVVGSARESAQRSHKLQAGIARSLAKELRTARAATDRVWGLVDDMRATSPAAADWADRLSVALSEQPGDADQ